MGVHGDLVGCWGDCMGFYGDLMGFVRVYPLANVYITKWKDAPFLMGTLTISTGPFSIAMLNYQRVVGKLVDGESHDYPMMVDGVRVIVVIGCRLNPTPLKNII